MPTKPRARPPRRTTTAADPPRRPFRVVSQLSCQFGAARRPSQSAWPCGPDRAGGPDRRPFRGRNSVELKVRGGRPGGRANRFGSAARCPDRAGGPDRRPFRGRQLSCQFGAARRPSQSAWPCGPDRAGGPDRRPFRGRNSVELKVRGGRAAEPIGLALLHAARTAQAVPVDEPSESSVLGSWAIERARLFPMESEVDPLRWQVETKRYGGRANLARLNHIARA